MSDRELLEAAAKAADISLDLTIRPDGLPLFCSDRGLAIDNVPGWWGPLTDDGDALRLAVALRLTVAVRFNECEVFEADFGECAASEPIFTASAFISAEQATDPAVATRRAIVRAAAAIGGTP